MIQLLFQRLSGHSNEQFGHHRVSSPANIDPKGSTIVCFIKHKGQVLSSKSRSVHSPYNSVLLLNFEIRSVNLGRGKSHLNSERIDGCFSIPATLGFMFHTHARFPLEPF